MRSARDPIIQQKNQNKLHLGSLLSGKELKRGQSPRQTNNLNNNFGSSLNKTN